MTPRSTTDPQSAPATRVVLRPVASPLPLGFLALGVATVAFASLQLAWIPPSEGRTVALGVLVLTVPLQLLAAVMGFLARDAVAATGMGILSGTWGAVCLATLTSPPGAASEGLGVILLCSSVALLVPAVSARSKLVPALVILTSAVRFAVTGIAQLDGGESWLRVAGWTGLVLAALSTYAALALELEATAGRTVLPLGRSGEVVGEPGVREQL